MHTSLCNSCSWGLSKIRFLIPVNFIRCFLTRHCRLHCLLQRRQLRHGMQQGIQFFIRSAGKFRSQRGPGCEGYAFARHCTVAAASPEHRHPPVALVQGASRGLGLEYVKQLLDRPEQRYSLPSALDHHKPHAQARWEQTLLGHAGWLPPAVILTAVLN